MFQFSAFPPLARYQSWSSGRFPDLGDLRIIAGLAAPRSFSQPCHVLRRLWTPRHPPFTLNNLTTCTCCHVLTTHLVFKDLRGPRLRCTSLRSRIPQVAVQPRTG